jgi:flagellar biosynthesis/type III secretory pathway M-ring protein FliF/YscJ
VLIGVIAVSVVMLFIVIEIIVHKARKRKLLKEDEEDEKSLTVEKLDEKTGNNIKAKNNKDEELGLV